MSLNISNLATKIVAKSQELAQARASGESEDVIDDLEAELYDLEEDLETAEQELQDSHQQRWN